MSDELIVRTWMTSVPPRGRGWVRSLKIKTLKLAATHPLPRGDTDRLQVRG